MTSRRGILAALEQAEGFVSGEELALRLGISRAAVWKHVGALKHAGYQIEGARAKGYRLAALPPSLTAGAIRSRLGPARIGRRIVIFDVTRSTNSDAMTLGREGAAEGTVVLAEEQTAGRGRLGRTWESSRGVNLYMSLLLRPPVAPHLAPQLSLVAGVAVAETVREEGIDARIKWPNDVVTLAAAAGRNGASLRKLAGILTEIEAEADRAAFVVIGIGVNLNSQAEHFSKQLAGKATSVLIERGSPADRTAFAARLLLRFEQLYDEWLARGFSAAAPRWRELSVLDGRRVSVVSPGESFEGHCAGIDDDGALRIDDGSGGQRRVVAGDVTISGGYDRCQP
ncbi:MAG TPA: biotin--[acetyl-CoA-carboxylase] ligase [Candidatus Binatia bacterium]|jgi:BirA family biotin operon repressor/biotin-[acetyl-CoA-carboxylase] ligase